MVAIGEVAQEPRPGEAPLKYFESCLKESRVSTKGWPALSLASRQ